MTPSEIAGRLMILSTKLQADSKTKDAETCAEAAALILVHLDRTTGNGEEAYNRTVTSSPIATVSPLFNSILKRGE